MAHDFGLGKALWWDHTWWWAAGETNHSPCNPGSKSKQPNQPEPKIPFERTSDPNTSREALPGTPSTISQDGREGEQLLSQWFEEDSSKPD